MPPFFFLYIWYSRAGCKTRVLMYVSEPHTHSLTIAFLYTDESSSPCLHRGFRMCIYNSLYNNNNIHQIPIYIYYYYYIVYGDWTSTKDATVKTIAICVYARKYNMYIRIIDTAFTTTRRTGPRSVLIRKNPCALLTIAKIKENIINVQLL